MDGPPGQTLTRSAAVIRQLELTVQALSQPEQQLIVAITRVIRARTMVPLLGRMTRSEELTVSDPTHPLYGHRFELASLSSVKVGGQRLFVSRGNVLLKIPVAATSLAPARPCLPVSKPSLASIRDLIRLGCRSGRQDGRHDRPKRIAAVLIPGDVRLAEPSTAGCRRSPGVHGCCLPGASRWTLDLLRIWRIAIWPSVSMRTCFRSGGSARQIERDNQ